MLQRMRLSLRSWSLATLWQTCTVACGSGLLVGGFTLLGQRILPGHFNQIANSGGIWLIFAFFIASLTTQERLAAIAGDAVLVGAVIGYYGCASLTYGFPTSYTYIVVWLVAASVFGPLFGMAGYWWRRSDPKRRVIGIALLGAALIAEGAYYCAAFHYIPEGVGAIILGFMFILVLSHSRQERAYALLALIPAVFLGGLGYLMLAFISTHLST